MSSIQKKANNDTNLADNEISIANNEVALLGLLLSEPTQESYLSISEQIKPEMFHFKSNQVLYSAISAVNNTSETFDLTNLWNYLDKNKLTDSVGAFGMKANEYIPYLTRNAGYISEIKTYQENIIKQYKTDKLLELLLNAKDIIENKKFEISDLLSKMQINLLNIDISEINSSYDQIGQTASSILNRILKRENNDEIGVGLSLGFPELDDLLLGINKGDLVIIGARPAMGKTAFALNIVNNVAKKNKTVLFFSLEMSNAQLVQRMMSIESLVPIKKLKNKNITVNDQNTLIQTVEQMKNWKVYLNERSTSTISDIITACKRFANNNKVDLVVIDYLQLISTSSNRSQESRQIEIATISRSLKQLARDIDCPVIALSQLSRNLEKREDKTPIMSDLRESGGIEQDADRVIFLHRPEYYKNKRDYNKTTDDSTNNNDENIHQHASVTNIIIGKNRHGATGIVQLVFYPEINRFIYDANKLREAKTKEDGIERIKED